MTPYLQYNQDKIITKRKLLSDIINYTSHSEDQLQILIIIYTHLNGIFPTQLDILVTYGLLVTNLIIIQRFGYLNLILIIKDLACLYFYIID